MILVTGATGLVGARIAFDLAMAGRPVRGMYRNAHNLASTRKIFQFYHPQDGDALFDKVSWFQADLRDTAQVTESLYGATAVIHAAALVSFDARDANKLIAENGETTANLVNSMLATGTKRLAFVSSVSALGQAPQGKCTDESHLFNPKFKTSVYGLSKYMSEMEVWRGSEEGLSVVIVNPSLVLGAGQPGQSSAQLVESLIKPRKFYPAGSNSFCDVRDLSTMVIRLLDSEISGERFVLISENRSFRDYLTVGYQLFGHSNPTQPMPGWMLAMAWRASWLMARLTGKRPALTRETAERINRNTCYSRAKLDALLPHRYHTLEESLAYFTPFYRA